MKQKNVMVKKEITKLGVGMNQEQGRQRVKMQWQLQLRLISLEILAILFS